MGLGDSLPLMGIGNASSIAAAGVAPRPYSLPLMGIGNWGRRRGCQRPHTLITPHGDREPSWGRPPLGPTCELITPHGDREHGGTATESRARTSHYPSWGSGTCVLVPSRRGLSGSLPLMGIGNTRESARQPDLDTSSLPLMGIGNPLILHFFHAGLPLEGAKNAATTPKFALGATVTSSFALKRTHEPSENGPVFAMP